jgi:hypothetical protein
VLSSVHHLSYALFSNTRKKVLSHPELRMTSRFARAVYVLPSCINSTPDATTSPATLFSSLNKTLVTGEETTTWRLSRAPALSRYS